jgi:hypothetical protein
MNPFASGDGDLNGFVSVRTATVTSAQANDGHDVRVSPFATEVSVPASVRVAQTGDVLVPEEGDTVYVGYRANGEVVILGARYDPEDSVPDYQPGERVVGHPASDTRIRFHSDGSLTVEGENGNTVELAADGSVIVNDGDTAPVTGVSTSTDGDGHVTSVSVSRASDVLVPT